MRQLSDRFLAAVTRCAGPQPIKQRLALAWSEELVHIREDQLPDSLRSQFIELRKAMHVAKPQPGETPSNASVRKMSTNQAANHVLSILQLSNAIMKTSYATIAPSEATSEPVMSEEKSEPVLYFEPNLGSQGRLN